MNGLYVDQTTGGYNLFEGGLEQRVTVATKANILLSTPLGTYIYDRSIGNSLINQPNLPSRSSIVNAINQCLNPLLLSGEISELLIEKIELSVAFRYKIFLVLVLPNGSQETMFWSKT
jgi:hypothetical protein